MEKIINERYALTKMIGTGGMADVYLANDLILGRKVALKMIRIDLANDPISLLRFKREAKAISKMDHQNIVQVFDVGEYEHRPFIVMEYVAGVTLKQLLLKRIALPLAEVIDIMKQLTSAVIHAHSHNIIHRDIKPHNVLIKDDGTAKITDFGIALSHDNMQITANDTVLGSAHYLAPELTNGEDASKLSDIYALGIVFYELVVGEVPFNGKTPIQVAMAHVNEPLPKIHTKNSSLPKQIQIIIEKACAKDVENRYASCEKMYEDIVNWEKLEVPQVVVEKPKRKYNIPVLVSGGSVIVMFLYIVVLMLFQPNKATVKKIMLPNVLGKTQEVATELLKQNGLQVVMEEEIASDTYVGGEVAKVTPDIDSLVEQNSVVKLAISKGRQVELPSFVGKNIKEVYEYLIKKKVVIQIEEKLTDAKEEPGTVIKQSIQANEMITITKDTKFVLDVAIPYQKVMVPNLVGMKAEEAIKKLTDLGIKYQLKGKNIITKMSIEPYSVIDTTIEVVLQGEL